MRKRLGVTMAAGLACSILALGAPGADAQQIEAPPSTEAETTTTVEDEPVSTDETTTTTDETTTTVEETTTTVEETTTTVEETTTTAETTTTLDPFPDAVEVTELSIPARTRNSFQTQPVPPPPTTTTTTTTTLPDPTILPWNSGTGRRAVYAKSAQRVWAVDADGTVLKTHRVSGKLKWCDPRVGTYSVWSRSRHTYAIQNPTIKWGYMIRFTKGCNGGNIGFHEIPNQYGRPVQSIAQLGQPLSGGCVRQAQSDAIWMWNWAQIGTKVVVLP